MNFETNPFCNEREYEEIKDFRAEQNFDKLIENEKNTLF
jgi:hypothetical protein